MSWETVKLADVCDVRDGTHASPKYQYSGYPLVTSKNIKDESINLVEVNYISEKDYDEINKRSKVDKGDILLPMIGTIGNPIIVTEEPQFAIKNVCLIKHTSRILNRYLIYVLKSSLFDSQLLNQSRGGTQKFISLSDIRAFQLPLPPMPIQRRIAEILDAANSLKRKDQALLKKYDDLTQAIFIGMFGDPVKNDKGWEVKKLKDISTKIHSGNTPKGGSNVYVKKGVTFFRSQNVWKNNLVYDDIAFIDKQTHLSMTKSSLKNKDILMTKTGRINTENSSLGRAALFLGADDSANVNGHVYLIRLQKNQIHEFVVHILTTKEYRGLIRDVCVGGIDKRQLNKEHIEDFPIIYPPPKAQQKFANIIKKIQAQRHIAELSAEKSESIFNSLIQKAFNGDLVE